MHPLVLALLICVVAAGLEGVFAGGGVKQRFVELRMPRLSPPLAVWIVIGVAYYAICFVVLYRLLVLPSTTIRTVALSLILAVLLFRLDRIAASALLPYAMYLFYANMWTYALWRANARPDLKSSRTF